MANISIQHRDELLLLYKITADDIAYFKTQQWAVTNYAMLLYASIVGVSQLIRPLQTSERFVLAVFALMVMCAALTVLFKLQKSIDVRRSRLTEVRRQFTEAFQLVWQVEGKGVEYVHSILFLWLAVVIGATAVAWLVGWRL